jgi:hypothetical protein
VKWSFYCKFTQHHQKNCFECVLCPLSITLNILTPTSDISFITCIWPINLKAMGRKTRPLKVYITIVNINNVINEKDYTTKEEVKK